MTVLDEITGTVYEVRWVRARQGLGVDHVQVGLAQLDGAT